MQIIELRTANRNITGYIVVASGKANEVVKAINDLRKKHDYIDNEEMINDLNDQYPEFYTYYIPEYETETAFVC